MARGLIPLRPKDFSTPLTQPEQSCLTWYALSGCTKKDAFITFARPDMLNSRAKAAIDDFVKQFYARKEVREYLDAYEATINEVLHPSSKKEVKGDQTTVEEKKSKALAKLVEYVLTQANDIENSDDPKAILDYANKIGIFDVDEQVDELPRRYLPVTCGDCAYRKFVEENCETVDDGTKFEAESR